MDRHSLAEIMLMVLAVSGALAIFSLVGSQLIRLTSSSHGPGSYGIVSSVGGVSRILFSVLIVALVTIGVALAVALKSKR